MKHSFWITLLCVLALTGCVNREQTDEKLARACVAGAKAFLPEGISVKEVKNESFKDNAKLGHGYREVTLTVIESDGWYEPEKTYTCVFSEKIAPFGLSYSADIFRLEMNEQVYGSKDDKVHGRIDEITKLNNAVRDALR